MLKSSPVVFVVDPDKAFSAQICGFVNSVGLQGISFDLVETFLETRSVDRPNCLVVNSVFLTARDSTLYKKLESLGCKMPMIVVADKHGDVTTAVTVMKNGALDYLEKPVDRSSFLDQIKIGHERDADIEILQISKRRITTAINSLTPRQKQVMKLCIRGERNKAIAHAMDVSIKTVEAHRAAVMHKMEAKSFVALVDDCRLIGLS